MGRVVPQQELVAIRTRLRSEGRKVVFTNGCFDIIHRGHVEYLAAARSLGDVLVVGVNDDASVRRLKGPGRPVVQAEDRAAVLAALAAVDLVTTFGEDTPLELIQAVVPDILVKGADWPLEKVVGREVVEKSGGSVRTIAFVPDRSTTSIVERIRKLPGHSS